MSARRFHLIAFLVSFAAAATAAPPPRNVILMIGDGLGPAHVTAARHQRGADFNIGRMPVTGFAATASADRAVTESAAAATALATGVKTNNGMVSVDPAGMPLTTVLEVAEKSGKVTGLVTTTYFFDATPAAFAAHAKLRSEYRNIATQMLSSGAELIAGAGLTALAKEEMSPVLELAKQSGYAVVTTRAELDKVTAPRVLAVFPEQPRDVDFPDAPLPVLTQWAIDRLKRSDAGFFLLVEHEGTDSSSHQNNTADVTASLASFDTAVGVALDFARTSGDTLVIVTADHETGGLRLSETRTGRLRLEWATSDHTAVAVPVFAFGPGSEAFAGFVENTEIGKKLLALVAMKP